MIYTRYGDLLEAKGIIVHGCNAQGVMGSGVARAIKQKFPAAYAAYKAKERFKGLKLGEISWAWCKDVLVVNAVTQEFYGRDPDKQYVSYDAVQTAFESIRETIIGDVVRLRPEVNFPMIGCGLGGGDWAVVAPIIDRALGQDVKKILWVK